jgi:hypothetical protein
MKEEVENSLPAEIGLHSTPTLFETEHVELLNNLSILHISKLPSLPSHFGLAR